uniref:Uncharacterized protein n=1 Tax=Arundo donax TaxID=35708 RepID=A0A0A8ZWR3_ARUDO
MKSLSSNTDGCGTLVLLLATQGISNENRPKKSHPSR